MGKVVSTVVRQVLTLVGGTGFMVSDSDVAQIASGLSVLVSVIWGIVNARREAKK